MDEWNAWRVRCLEEVAEVRRSKGKKAEPIGKPQEKEEREEIEVWIDEVIEQIEEEIVE